jgi:hypothetical protein
MRRYRGCSRALQMSRVPLTAHLLVFAILAGATAGCGGAEIQPQAESRVESTYSLGSSVSGNIVSVQVQRSDDCEHPLGTVRHCEGALPADDQLVRLVAGGVTQEERPNGLGYAAFDVGAIASITRGGDPGRALVSLPGVRPTSFLRRVQLYPRH